MGGAVPHALSVGELEDLLLAVDDPERSVRVPHANVAGAKRPQRLQRTAAALQRHACTGRSADISTYQKQQQHSHATGVLCCLRTDMLIYAIHSRRFVRRIGSDVGRSTLREYPEYLREYSEYPP